MKTAAKPISSWSRVNSCEHLLLHRDVQRTGRLVGDHQRRLQRERARQGDALALATRELAGQALGEVRGEEHGVEQLGHPGAT